MSIASQGNTLATLITLPILISLEYIIVGAGEKIDYGTCICNKGFFGYGLGSKKWHLVGSGDTMLHCKMHS